MHALVDHYGNALVFFNVLLLSLGLPVPAMPTLVLIGATLALRASGHADAGGFAVTLAVSVCACLIGDTVWYRAGRRYGHRTLQSLCRLSLSQDSCMKRTERLYGQWGVRVLAVARFIPGLSMVAVPMSGALGVAYPRFLRLAALGALLWSGAGLLLGVLFARQVDGVLDLLAALGLRAGLVLAALLGLYIAWRAWRRLRLARQLARQRIGVDELHALVEAGRKPVILDIRAEGYRGLDPYVIPGAEFADERQLDDILGKHGPDEKIVIYCGCPNEVSAAWLAGQLREQHYRDVLPLTGGLDAWREAGYPVLPLPESG